MTMTDLYTRCLSLSWDVVQAELSALDTLPAAEVRAAYRAMGFASWCSVTQMRVAIRRAVLGRKGAAERVTM